MVSKYKHQEFSLNWEMPTRGETNPMVDGQRKRSDVRRGAIPVEPKMSHGIQTAVS